MDAVKLAGGTAYYFSINLNDATARAKLGQALVEKLRANRDDFAVIFMTGYTEASVLENARIKSGAVILNKPFSADVLAAKINELQQGPGKAMAAGSSG